MNIGGNKMKDLAKMKREEEKKKCDLVNLILDYVVENKMSLKEIDECVEIVKQPFYSDAYIKRQ